MALWITLCVVALVAQSSTGNTQFSSFSNHPFSNFESSRTIPRFGSSSLSSSSSPSSSLSSSSLSSLSSPSSSSSSFILPSSSSSSSPSSSSSSSSSPSTLSSSRFGASSIFNSNPPFSSTSSRNSFLSSPSFTSSFNSPSASFRSNEFSSPFESFQNINRQPQSHSHHRQASHFPGSIVSSSNTNPQSQFSQFVSRDTPHQSDESKWKFHFAFHNTPNDNAHSTTSAHFQSAFTDDDEDGEVEGPMDNESSLQREGRQIISETFTPKANTAQNNMQNIVIPLPSHHFKDRSSGMIVISQDEGAFGGRDSSVEDSRENGRQFHYDLLTSTNSQTVTTEPTAPIKRDIGNTVTGSEVSRASSETVGDSESNEEDVTDGQDEKENRLNGNTDTAADNGGVHSDTDTSSIENDNKNDDDDSPTKKNSTVNNNNVEHDSNNSLAAAFTITMAHDNDNDKKAKGQKRKFASVADFISSKVAARIHLSRPKSSVNITLTHGPEMSIDRLNGGSNKSADKVKSKFNRFNTSPANGDSASVMLLVESELRNKKHNKAQRNDNKNDNAPDVSSNQISRSRRRHQSDNSAQNSVNDRKKNKNSSTTTAAVAANNSTTTTTTTTTTTSTTTTEAPEITTTTAGASLLSSLNETSFESGGNTTHSQTVLNTLVKEFNLALNDKIRQLENINETMMSMFGTTSMDETTITPTTVIEGANNGNGSENNLQLSITTTTTTSTESPATSEPEVEITTVSSSNDSTEEREQSTTTITSLTMDVKDSSLPESTTNTAVDGDNSNSMTTAKADNETGAVKEVTTVPSITADSDNENTTVIPAATTTLAPTTTVTPSTTTTSTSSTTTTTTTTTTPAPKTTTTTARTPAAAVTSKPKRETQPKTGKSHKINKTNKKSSKPTSKPTPKPVKNNGTSSLKLKMNVTLPIHRPEGDESSGPALSHHHHHRPALQLALGISSSTSNSEHKPDVVTDFDDLPIIVERRAPSTPRIPNNFGFSNEVIESFHVPVRGRSQQQQAKPAGQRRASKQDTQNSHSHSQTLFSIVPSPMLDDNEDGVNNNESAAARFVRLALSPTGSGTASSTTSTTTSTTTTTPLPESFEDMSDSDNDSAEDGAQDDDDDSQSSNPEANVPGTAGVDYPILSHIPDTGFDCAQQKYPGFYSDMSVGCQVYHSCSLAAIRARPRRREPEIEDDAEVAASSHAYSYAESRTVPRKISAASTRNIQHGTSNSPGMNGNGGRHHSFLCPNGTIFSQEYLICDWWYNVKCDQSPKFYPLNRDVYSSGLVSSTLPAQSNSNSVQSPVAASSNHKPLLVSAGGVRLHATTYRSSASSHLTRPLLSHQQTSSVFSTTNRHYSSYYSN